MTSEHADRQILDDLSGQPEVKQDVGVFGSQDRLTEAPRVNQCPECGSLDVWLILNTAQDAIVGFDCRTCNWWGNA